MANLGGYSDFSLSNSEALKYLLEITKVFKENNYDIIFLPLDLEKTINYCDAIICILLSDEEYELVCKNNYIPVIALDSNAKDPWNFEIISTFGNIKDFISTDDYTLVLYKPKSDYIASLIEKNNNGKVFFINSVTEIDALSSISSRTLVTPYNNLFAFLKNKVPNIIKYRIDTTNKINTLLKCTKLAIDHVEVDKHKYIID